jgi:hypothetical protein
MPQSKNLIRYFVLNEAADFWTRLESIFHKDDLGF